MDAPKVPERRVPNRSISLSEIGLALDPDVTAPPRTDGAAIRVLQLARAHGVTTYDLAGARHPARAEQLLVAAFPRADNGLRIVGGGLSESARAEAGHGRARSSADATETGALRRWVEGSNRRIAPHRISVLDVSAIVRDRSSGGARVLPTHDLVADGTVAAWTFRGPVGPAESGGPSQGPDLLSVDSSLLRPSALADAGEWAARNDAGILVRDPLAGGRLDGTRYATGVGDRPPVGRPLDVRTLSRELGPLLRLGFLAVRGRRTLLQSAMRYLLDEPRVVSILVPVPSPERLDELLRSVEVPALTPEERDRVARTLPE